MDTELSPRSCLNSIIALLLLLLFCFIIGIAVQIGWQLLTEASTTKTIQSTPIVLPTVIAANTKAALVSEATGTTPSISASKTKQASKTTKASRTPTILPTVATPTPIEYIVGAGDTLSAIARQYNISIEDILAINPELNADRLRLGQVIIIPTLTPTTLSGRQTRTPSASGTRSHFISPTRTLLKSPTSRSTASNRTEHTIQAGDTLLDIASQYNISLEALLAANPHLNPQALKIGDVIVIPRE